MFLMQSSKKNSRIAFLNSINMAFKLSPNLTNEDNEKILITFIFDYDEMRHSMEKFVPIKVDRLFHQPAI